MRAWGDRGRDACSMFVDLRGEAMASAAMKDLDPHVAAMTDARACLKKGLDSDLSEDQLKIQVDNLIHYMGKFDEQVKVAKRSIPKVVKPKAAAKNKA